MFGIYQSTYFQPWHAENLMFPAFVKEFASEFNGSFMVYVIQETVERQEFLLVGCKFDEGESLGFCQSRKF